MFAIYIVMPQIVDIKIIKGRRAEAIEEDNIRNNMLRKRAEAEYAEYKKSSRQNTQSIEEWAQWKPDYKEVYNKPVSIEQQMLDLIKDGWEPKGELIFSEKESVFFQTMVLYDGPVMTVTEDLLSLTTEVPDPRTSVTPALLTTPDTPAHTVLDHATC